MTINASISLRPGQPLPLYCLARHPGQSHLLAVGGSATDAPLSTSISGLTDLQADSKDARGRASCQGDKDCSDGGTTGNSSATAYIWDLRADRYPLTELACPGRGVWEAMFHPTSPKYLCLATETAGLLGICSSDRNGEKSGAMISTVIDEVLLIIWLALQARNF
ncbi:unnamed protein product [Protopolystoma xenopodis]|uniref:Uncharacterized protein n=1 Tax=Protopolystoma xenopodis TaxID=117903 RepID=A0A448XGI7_9PLAT|nr:unnamed protein product [Protopolystoma xenopodis]